MRRSLAIAVVLLGLLLLLAPEALRIEPGGSWPGVALADSLGRSDGGAGTASSYTVAPYSRVATVRRGYDYWSYHYSKAHTSYGTDTIQVRRVSPATGDATRIPMAMLCVWYNADSASATTADSLQITFYDGDGDSTFARMNASDETIRGPWVFYPRAEFARYKCLGGEGLHKWQIWAYYAL